MLGALTAAWVGSSVAALPTAGQGSVRVSDNDPFAVSLTFELQGLRHETIWTDQERVDRFVLDGEPAVGPEGYPDLPAVTRLVIIPPRSGVDLHIDNLRTRVVPNVHPTLRQALSSSDHLASSEAFVGRTGASRNPVDLAECGPDGFWPREVATLGRPNVMRGWRIVPVLINPVRWNPETGELQVIESMDLSLDFTSERNMVNLVENPDRPRPSRYIHRLIRSIVVNPPPERDEVNGAGAIAYVLGSGGSWDAIANALAPLVEWRRQMGWTVNLIRVDNTQNTANVLQAIREAYNNWEVPPEYVVICGDTDGSFPIAYWNEQNGAAYPYETDFHYGNLEGDDPDFLPEAAVGRLVFDSAQMLQGHVNKIVNYESDPFLGDGNQAGWFRRAAVAATDSRSGVSSIEVCRWFRNTALERGFTDVPYLFWDQNNPQPNPTQFIQDRFAAGISFFLYRGWTNMNGFAHDNVNNLRNGRMLPFVMLATCNTGDYAEHIYNPYYSFAERFSYYTGGGAIGCVGTAGATHTAYNNLIAAATMRAPFIEGIYSQGWALMRGRLALYSHYAGRGDIRHEENRNMDAWETEFYIYNLMGDPAVDLFTYTPARLEVEAPEALNTGNSRFSARVTYAEGDAPVAGATACLYKPRTFQLVKTTDGEGRVDFTLNPEDLEDGTVYFTVTGHNLFPHRQTYRITQADTFIGAGAAAVDDDEQGASRGNGDGVANPTERIELALDLTNFGSQDLEGEMTATLTAVSPFIQVLEPQRRFDAAPNSGESVTGTWVVDVGGAYPAGTDAELELTVQVNQSRWLSRVKVPVQGPQLEFESLQWAGNPLEPEGIADLYITLRNTGTRNSPALQATLFSQTVTVPVIQPRGTFGGIQAGATGRSEGTFRVSASLFHFGGNWAHLGVALRADNGFQDTAYFSFIVGEARQDMPFGPDRYGYVCMDNTDQDMFNVPEYEWVEIDPNRNGPGTNTNLRDSGEGQDMSVVVNLPFDFVYYGRRFSRVTICSNGWLAPGDQSHMASFRNRRIPDGEMPPGIIAPFWDELIIPNGSGVYYWFDQENHRFIVEWSRLRRYGPQGNNEASETFQVILHDPRYYPSFTGDGNILFQYLDVTDSRSCFQDWDTPFATVGIGSPDQSDGLEYSYWNTLHPGAAPLEDDRAILFTTVIDFRLGHARGRVWDAATNEPLSDVMIYTTYGFTGITDANGFYFIPNMLADSVRLYAFTATKPGWNDSTITSVEIVEGDTVEVNFGLRHPEFRLSTPRFELEMIADTTVNGQITLTNTGNGPLTFTSKFDYNLEGRDDPDEMWDVLAMWDVGSAANTSRLHGVAFARDRWIISGAYNNAGEWEKYLYIYSRSGEYIGLLNQPETGARYGIADLDFYDGFLYAASNSRSILRINPETGQAVNVWMTPNNQRAVAALTVTDDGKIIAGQISGDLYMYEVVDDTTLRVLNTFNVRDPQTNTTLYKFGLGWFRDDPDGFKLYMMGKISSDQDGVLIYKMNTETGEIRHIANLSNLGEGLNGKLGMCITPKWNNMVWVLAALLDHTEGDRLALLELGPNASWLRYDPVGGMLDPASSTAINLHFNTADLDTGIYGVIIRFTHNALGGRTDFPIGLHIVDSLVVQDTTDTTGAPDPLTPLRFGLEPNHPNPFNPVTSIGFTLDREGVAELTVWDITGRRVATLAKGYYRPGRYQVSFRAEGLPNGVYLYQLKSAGRLAGRKMVVLK